MIAMRMMNMIFHEHEYVCVIVCVCVCAGSYSMWSGWHMHTHQTHTIQRTEHLQDDGRHEVQYCGHTSCY